MVLTCQYEGQGEGYESYRRLEASARQACGQAYGRDIWCLDSGFASSGCEWLHTVRRLVWLAN